MRNSKNLRRNPPTSRMSEKVIARRIAPAVRILIHGIDQPAPRTPEIDPRVLAGIDFYADQLADREGDPWVGVFARDILRDSALVMAESFNDDYEVPGDDRDADLTIDLLTDTRKNGS